jgi:tetratricopeptide (TPR) repeat protein
MTWSEKRKALAAAIDERRFEDAERIFGELQALTREQTDPRFEADERFAEGMLRDAQGRFDEAEAAFRAALALDRRHRGERHSAVGDTLHSIAIVQGRRGDHAGALESYRASLEIFQASQSTHVPGVLCSIGGQLLALGREDEALEAFEDAEKVARESEKIPRHDLARALVGAGEALRRSKQWVPAFTKFATCTKLATSSMWPKLAREVAGAWLGLGVVSRYALRNTQEQAAYAFWFASVVGGNGEARDKANAQLETMDEAVRAIATGDPEQLRVVYRDDAGNTHVASSVRGLHHVRTKDAFAIGAAVALVEGKLVALH